MPNHVEQDLWVTGSSETLREFMVFAKEDELLLSANKFIPYPEEYATLDKQAEEERKKGNFFAKDGFNSGGYQWVRQNWGTTWGIYNAELLSEKLTGKSGKLKYTCESAWSPATLIVDAMSKKFPTLKFVMKYYEQGMQFKGHYIVQGGEILLDEESKYTGHRGG